MGSIEDSLPLTFLTLPSEVKGCVFLRGFGGHAALALRAANRACRSEVDAATRSLVARVEPADSHSTRSTSLATSVMWPARAVQSLQSILQQLPGLLHVDLLCFPGLRPMPAWPFLYILGYLPESTIIVQLPLLTIRDVNDLAKLKRYLYFVPTWTFEIDLTLVTDEENPLLFPGAVLLAESWLSGDFREAVIFLLGHTESHGWCGIVVNGPGIEGEMSCVKWGGPMSDALSQLWEIQVETQPVLCGDARLLDSRGLQYLGEDWTASVVESASLVPRSERNYFKGYAGWAEGQLERELRAGRWKLMCCPARLLFTEANVYSALAAAIRPPEPSLSLYL